MSELEEAITSLKLLKWSEYEAKTFAALVYQGISTASQISKKSNVPTNRTYQVLDKLIDKGFVKKIAGFGAPSQYEAVNPESILDNLLQDQTNMINKAKLELSQLQERNKDTDIPHTYTIIGKRELNNHISELIDKTQSSLKIFVDTLIELDDPLVIEKLNKISEEVDILILTPERGINDRYEKDVYEKLKKVDLLITEEVFSSILIIADDRFLVFTSFAYTEKSDTRDYFGVYLEDNKTSKMFTKMFNLAWDDGRKALNLDL